MKREEICFEAYRCFIDASTGSVVIAAVIGVGAYLSAAVSAA